ncbi:MAG: IS30 family transposase [Acidimicrobiales bacterium]
MTISKELARGVHGVTASVSHECIYAAVYAHGRWGLPAGLHKGLHRQQRCRKHRRSTIYVAVYNGTLEVKARECLRMRRPPVARGTARNPSNRPALPNIVNRPATVNDRTEAGHWDVDQIIGAHNRSSMIWLSERVSRYSIPITMPCGYAAVDVLAGLVEACDQIPPHLLRSLSFDQGSEWDEWETIAAGYDLDCWFCEPHSPWQRGAMATAALLGPRRRAIRL